MLTTNQTSRLVSTLTEETWNKARRNVVAKRIGEMRKDIGDSDPVIAMHQPIEKQGVVGRYDAKRAELLRVVAEASGCAAEIASKPYAYQGTRREYTVRIFGHRSDCNRALDLYRELLLFAIGHMQGITGEKVLARRRAYFTEFLDVISTRLQEVGKAPAVAEWLKNHREDAYRAREESGTNGFINS